jgi:hypothetical protein
MGKVLLIRLVAITPVVLLAAIAGTDLPPADPPSPGERCPVLHATTQDSHGHMMWCVHMIDGPSDPVWQYSGTF